MIVRKYEREQQTLQVCRPQYESNRLGIEVRRLSKSAACCAGEERSISIASIATDGDELINELPNIEDPSVEFPIVGEA